MNQNKLKSTISEEINFVICSFVMTLILCVWYYKGDLGTNLILALTQIIVFTLPGYALITFIDQNISFIYRYVIGIILGYAIVVLFIVWGGVTQLYYVPAIIAVIAIIIKEVTWAKKN